MIIKPCPRCKRQMIPVGLSYCSDCSEIVTKEVEAIREKNRLKKNRQYNNNRSKKYIAFYRSKDWRVTSRAKLESTEYKCEAKLPGCKIIATEVHHIQPIQTPEGWDRRLDWDNLECVCVSCHNARHPEKLNRHKNENENNFVIDLRDVKKNL